MVHWHKALAVPALAAVMLFAALAVQQSSAAAYGAADQPLAQIEVSVNCNNPDAAFCEGEAGGGWFWIEVDEGGTGDIAGAFCGHTIGGIGGPGGAGAIGVRGDIEWSYSNMADGLAAGAELAAEDPGDSYYLVTVPDGELVLFPTTPGHYSYHPDPGVALELQVAP